VAGSCEYGDEPLGSGATELVILHLTALSMSLDLDRVELGCD
jgi:hypothetical protein